MPALEKEADNTADRDLFEHLYESYNKLVYSLAYSKLRNQDLAEECVQDTFLIVVKKIGVFKSMDENYCRNLICTIARGKAVDSIRKENIYELSAETADLDTSFFDPFRSIDLSEQLQKLGDREQTYIFLKFVYGFSNVEIAKIYKQSASYTGRVINGALLKMKKELEEKNYE